MNCSSPEENYALKPGDWNLLYFKSQALYVRIPSSIFRQYENNKRMKHRRCTSGSCTKHK